MLSWEVPMKFVENLESGEVTRVTAPEAKRLVDAGTHMRTDPPSAAPEAPKPVKKAPAKKRRTRRKTTKSD